MAADRHELIRVMPAKREEIPIPQPFRSFDVAILGGGVIGLAVAWRAAQRGLTVCVVERGELGGGASHVAAGMLAPVSEADPAEPAVLELGIESARRWPSFAGELRAASGIDVGHRRCGTLLVARDRDGAEGLERLEDIHRRLGLEAQRLLPSAARRLEPGLAPTIRAALHVPGDHAVDPRLVTRALAGAAVAAGVELRSRTTVAAVVPGEGLLLAGGALVPAGQVVLAAGAWSGELDGLPVAARVPVRPIKGQTLRLRDRGDGTPPAAERVVRFEGGYLVPRGDGEYVLGATVEERGFDTAITAGGAYELLRDAAEVLPGVLELELQEAIAGLRPGTPDNAPVLGRSAVEGVVWATGHHRHGILLAPISADLVTDELVGVAVDHRFGPGRFAAGPAVPALAEALR